MRIALSAGHGPETAGKRCPDDSMREYAFNSAVANHVVELLSVYQVELLKVYDDNKDVPLGERVSKANAWKADVYVSIHANAAGNGWSDANGIETWVYEASGEAYALACEVQTQLIRATNRKNRSVKVSKELYELNSTRMPAILVEGGFMTNREEAALLKSDAYRQKVAQAIVQGLVKFYKLQPKVQLKRALPIAQGYCTVVCEGKEVEGVIINGSSYIPARAISELLGHRIAWDGINKVVTITK